MSSFKITSKATIQPISLEEAKAQLRVDHDDEDSLIQIYIDAARQHAERFTGLSFAAQTIQYSYTEKETNFSLPLSPVAEIVSVTDGVDDVEYTSDIISSPATISIDTSIDRVVVTYKTDESAFEQDINLAMLLLINHMYDNRGMVESMTVERIEEAYLRHHRVAKGMA
jgi:hypothetical protein